MKSQHVVEVQRSQLQSGRRRRFPARAGLGMLALGALVTSCGSGARPVLIEGDRLLVSAAEIAAELAPAPQGTPALTIPPDLEFQATAEDALDHWAERTATSFRGDCSNPIFDEPELGAPVLCSAPTARETTVHLGPDPSQTWYVITLAETPEGLKVAETAIAGRP